MNRTHSFEKNISRVVHRRPFFIQLKPRHAICLGENKKSGHGMAAFEEVGRYSPKASSQPFTMRIMQIDARALMP
jgi:hypothetical protein